MQYEKKFTKTKIFLYVLFIIFAIAFTGWVYKFYSSSKEVIFKERETVDCLNLDFDLKTIRYQQNTLDFELISLKADNQPITQVTILGKVANKTHKINSLGAKDSRFIRISDIEIGESFKIYVEKCNNNIKEYQI